MRVLNVKLQDYAEDVAEASNTCQWALVEKDKLTKDFVVISPAYKCLDFFVDDHSFWKLGKDYPGENNDDGSIYGWLPRPVSPCKNYAILMLCSKSQLPLIKQRAAVLSKKLNWRTLKLEQVELTDEGLPRRSQTKYTRNILITFPREVMRHPAYLHALLVCLREENEKSMTALEFFRNKGKDIKVELRRPDLITRRGLHNAGGSMTLGFYLRKEVYDQGPWVVA